MTGPLVVTNPATGDTVGEAASYNADDAIKAVARAADAQRAWARVAPRDRAEVLRACFEAMLSAEADLADLIVAENGKPRRDAVAEVRYAADFFRWNAEEAVRIDGEVGTVPNGSARKIVLRQPIGVVLAVTPWNLPAAMLTRKIAPALAAGCAVVTKPAPATPLTAVALAALMAAAGVPEGLVQVLPTHHDEALVRACLAEPDVRKLSFTGSTATGARLLELAAPRVLSCSLELGGNAPFVVLGDADLSPSLDAALVAKLRHNSQACTAANRFFVAESVAVAFTDALVDAFANLSVGPGRDPTTEVGPLIDERAAAKVDRLVRAAVDHGARVAIGGNRIGGSYYAPTVLTGVTPDSPILREEIFGPVAPIVVVPDDDDTILRLANDSDLGLAGYVCGGDLARALSVAERLDVGMVGVNRGIVSDPAAPFGGVKQSGLGREGGHEGVLAFTETKLIATEWR